MAHAPAPVTQPPMTEDAFLADRMRFWSGWCTFVVANVIIIIAILVLMTVFLV
jgi:hypothetical protein